MKKIKIIRNDKNKKKKLGENKEKRDMKRNEWKKIGNEKKKCPHITMIIHY